MHCFFHKYISKIDEAHDMSPKKKKMKTDTNDSNTLKRQNESEGSSSKRSKSEKNEEDELRAMRRKNFVIACEQVSYKAYFDHRSRLLLLYLPSCLKTSVCKHHDSKNVDIKEMLSHAEEAFMIDIRANMWYEALEVCILSITPTQYLSANVMREIIEIMLNAHEDEDADYSISDLIAKCQHILMQNFSTHPPCLKKQLRSCYNNFLNSPLDQKEKTFSNRNEFGRDEGIVKYCMNRLQYEISSDSKDGSLVNKYENIPEEMKQSVRGLHWQKEKFEIYEVLERTERIDRLMVVLETIIELLQFDLAIWHCRYTHNLGNHIMRSHKPLMAFILWSNNILYTGTVNNSCRQILKIFAQMIHLQYPEKYVKILTTWINAVIQTFYICETNSNRDYPNTGKYCSAFAKDFYKVISEMPNDSIVRILEMIKPAFMKNLIGTLHLKKLLSTEENCVIKNLIEFVKESKWNMYPKAECEIHISQDLFPKPRKFKNILRYLTTKCTEWGSEAMDISEDSRMVYFPKMNLDVDTKQLPDQNHLLHTFYLTLEAYLDAYSIRDFQKTLESLNEKLVQDDSSDITNNEYFRGINSFSVTEQFVKKYRSIYQMLTELVLVLQELKGEGDLPDVLKVLKNIDCLDI